MVKKFLFIIMIVLLSTPALAATGRVTLLTFTDEGGGTADLYLETTPGTGRIYFESSPLTKIDTQISTRFAKEIACDAIGKDCSQTDFFYTIRANAPIVGGPSAGGAVAVLTIAVLESYELNQSVTMTGTINSGGLIGPVGGVKEKIEAAQREGFQKVLIPKFSLDENQSLENFTSNYSLEAVEVSTLREAVKEFTGEELGEEATEFEVPEKYTRIMKGITEELCNQTEALFEKLPETNNTHYRRAAEFYNFSKQSLNESDYYSSASYCFTANVRLRTVEIENTSQEARQNTRSLVREKLESFEEKTDGRELNTFSDLETYMIVKERIQDSKVAVAEMNLSNAYDLAYALERYNSAVAWSRFFSMDAGELSLDEDSLRRGCLSKMAEGRERISYSRIFLPGALNETEQGLDFARADYENGDYELCLFKAAKAKAEANVFISALSISPEHYEEFVQDKIESSKKVIAGQAGRGIFPILGYSYYEYSRSLAGFEQATSLTFAEYAIEMSNLDMYFPGEEEASIRINPFTIAFGMGALAGILLSLLGYWAYMFFKK